MQTEHIQELVARLKENNDTQVETTTLGKFLGARGDKLAMVLGKEVLSRPILVNTSTDSAQVIDLESGLVLPLKDFDDLVPKLTNILSSQAINKPKEAVEGAESATPCEMSEEVLEIEFSSQLFEINQKMQKSDRVENKMELVQRTIIVLETQKAKCEDGEYEKIAKAQQKLENLIKHSREKRLAPGQIPSVFEIAIWCWVN